VASISRADCQTLCKVSRYPVLALSLDCGRFLRARPRPLRALFDTQKIHKRSFYRDGRFATLEAVVDHYDNHFKLKLSTVQKRELIEYLKSI
jgi:hypothetical protein